MYEEKSAALDELTFEPGEHRAAATDISNSDIISGYIVGTPVSFGAQPVFWTASGGAVLLGQDDDDTVATGVNAGGAIVGTYTEPSEPSTQALMWSPPDYAQITLQGLPCDHCFTLFANSVNAINNRGIAVGQSLGNDGALAVEWQSGTVTSLGSLDNSGGSDAYAINNKGDVVGDSSTTQPMQPQHAFLYHQGVMTDLGTLAGDAASTARSINKEGQIVGTSFNSVNSGRAFLYQNGQMYDLNSLIKPTSPLTGLVKFAGAVSISSRGWIAVNGIDTRDQLTHAFLLIPAR
jgi:probable HAF family extracellular repeat protein